MDKLNLSRSELIFCGILLLGAVGFGVYRLDQAIYKMRAPQIFEEATQIVDPGETLSLAYREVGREDNQITWNGTVEMTVKKVALYHSYTDARTAGERVANPNGLLGDKNNPFLIIEVDVTNIDADEDGNTVHGDGTAAGVSSDTDGAITLRQVFSLYSETPFNHTGSYLASSLWCVDGKSSSDYSTVASIPQGQTAHVTLGFSLEEGAEEHLDGAFLEYRSFYDLMSIGSPAFEGETHAAASN